MKKMFLMLLSCFLTVGLFAMSDSRKNNKDSEKKGSIVKLKKNRQVEEQYCATGTSTTQNGTVIHCKGCSNVSQERAEMQRDQCFLTALMEIQE